MTTTSAASSSLCALTKSSRLRGADFLFAFEDDLDVDRQPAVLLQVRLDRLEVHEHLALVVGRAARVDLAVADRRLERRRLPQVERIDRLHVVVAVEQDRRRALGAEPVAVDDRDARASRSAGRSAGRCAASRRRSTRRSAGRPPACSRQRADAGDGEVGLQLVDVAVAVGVDEVDDVVHGASVDALGVSRFGHLRSADLPGRPIPSTSRRSCAPADSRAAAARDRSARRGSRPGSR